MLHIAVVVGAPEAQRDLLERGGLLPTVVAMHRHRSHAVTDPDHDGVGNRAGRRLRSRGGHITVSDDDERRRVERPLAGDLVALVESLLKVGRSGFEGHIHRKAIERIAHDLLVEGVLNDRKRIGVEGDDGDARRLHVEAVEDRLDDLARTRRARELRVVRTRVLQLHAWRDIEEDQEMARRVLGRSGVDGDGVPRGKEEESPSCRARAENAQERCERHGAPRRASGAKCQSSHAKHPAGMESFGDSDHQHGGERRNDGESGSDRHHGVYRMPSSPTRCSASAPSPMVAKRWNSSRGTVPSVRKRAGRMRSM